MKSDRSLSATSDANQPVNIPKLAKEGDLAIAEGVIRQFSVNPITQTCEIVYLAPITGDRKIITIGFDLVEMFLNAMRGAYRCGMLTERAAKVRKVVVNTGNGKFSLSQEALERLIELGHPDISSLTSSTVSVDGDGTEASSEIDLSAFSNLDRSDPLLIKVLEELGERAWGEQAQLEIASLPVPTIKITRRNGQEIPIWDLPT